MVFESIVVDILNKFLGDYVENLDRSQLQIGIWGGDVTLRNLNLKPSALDELNLPVKTIYGHLGKLVLKIPWKNIYTAPVEVLVEELFLLCTPIQDIVYNEEKEEKYKQELKRSLIDKVELAKKSVVEKDSKKVDDTFVEKLAAQIIKNVQIFIQNIHIRYEDRVTKPEHPFSIGVTLHSLNVHTTKEGGENYIPPQENSPIFHKKMVMEGLSLYWNTNSTSFLKHNEDEVKIMEYFMNGISSNTHKITDYEFILQPINSEARLEMNSKPEITNFATPKMFLNFVLEQLIIHINRSQYQNMIALIDNFDRMSRGVPYRKYRPNLVEYKGHAKEWWKFAITSILEVEVKRRSKEWNWKFIKLHIENRNAYRRAYKIKLTQKQTEQNKKELAGLEDTLDAINIIMLRQIVENEVEREGRLLAEQKKSTNKGWFGGWFSTSSASSTDQTDESVAIAKKIENVMTDEEKRKLYAAIDYHESSAPTSYPPSFVAIRLAFKLNLLRIDIYDDYHNSGTVTSATRVLSIEFNNAIVSFVQRPAAQSMALSVKMQSFHTMGLKQMNVVPEIVKSNLDFDAADSAPFLDVFFELNPDDESFDQRLYVTLKPLKVVYDAQTVIRILEFFTPEKDISSIKNQIQSAASTTIEEMREKSAFSLQHAIDKSIKLDLKIDFMAPYLIIPFGGFYTKKEMTLVVNLGRIIIQSKKRTETTQMLLKRMRSLDRSGDDLLKEMFSYCYDQFTVSLNDVQMLTLNSGEIWLPSLDCTSTLKNYILQPISINIELYKSIITDDPRLPKIKVNGCLPDVTIKTTEKRLLEVVGLILSLPLPQSDITESENKEKVDIAAASVNSSTLSLRQRLESFNKLNLNKKIKKKSDTEEMDGESTTEVTADLANVEVNFCWKALTLLIEADDSNTPLIEISVTGLELNLVQRLYSLEMATKLKNISLTQNYLGNVVPTLSSPTGGDTETYLFSCKVLIADKNSQFFNTIYNNTGIFVELEFSKIFVIAHQEAILNTIQLVNSLQSQIMEMVAANNEKSLGTNLSKSDSENNRRTSVSSTTSNTNIHVRRNLKQKSKLAIILEDQMSNLGSADLRSEGENKKNETIELKLVAKLDVIQMCLQTENKPLASMDITGITTNITLNKSSTEVGAILKSISVCDLNPETKLYNKVASIKQGDDVFKMNMRINNHENSSSHDAFDVYFGLQMSCMELVFTNEFLMDVLAFMNNFQSGKQMVVNASVAAVATAAQNVQEVYQSSTKVSLNIFAVAPIIIVPKNKYSNEVLIADLGNLIVKNKLVTLTETGGKHVIVDETSISLNDMKIVKTNYERTEVERLLLKPINYSLLVKRNLSAWFTHIPTIDIDGSSNSIHVSIRDTDYKLLMDTLKENIGATPSRQVPNVTSTSASPKTTTIIETAEINNANVTVETSDTAEATIFLKFAMKVESVILELYTGTVPNESQDDGLASFTLSLLCVKGFMESNNDLSVRASISDCCLDDTRHCKAANPVRRFMHRKTSDDLTIINNHLLSTMLSTNDETSTERNMIEAQYKQEKDIMDVTLKVYSFVLIFNMEHIMKIQEFFMLPLTDASNVGKDTHVKSQEIITKATESEVINTESSLSVMSFNVTLEKPDIILVESLDDIDTNALILNNEAEFFIQMSNDDRMSINGTMKNLQLFTCCYNPMKRNETTSLVIYPMTVDVAGSSAKDTNIKLDTNISDIKISITPGIIQLLTRISATLTPQSVDNTNQDDQKLFNYTNVWEQKPMSPNHRFLNLTDEGIDVAEHPIFIDNSIKSNKKNKIMINASCIEINLEPGFEKGSGPLLIIQSSFQGTLNMTSEKMALEASVSLEVAYFNSSLGLWEPIIEPASIESPDLIHSNCNTSN